MLNIEGLQDLQAVYRVTQTSIAESAVTIQEYTADCLKSLRDAMPPEYHNNKWNDERKQRERDRWIMSFVHEHAVRVQGFLTEQDTLNESAMVDYLIAFCNGEGVLKDALENPDVDEIQVNDKNTVYCVVHGVPQLLRDSKGNPVMFPDNDTIEQIIQRLIDDGSASVPNFTSGAPILNAKTARKQYRISAVYHTLNARDKNDLSSPITTAVIRKFPDNALTLDDLVKSGTITRKIAKLLTLLGRVKLNIFFVGETGSGKTTLMQAVCRSISYDDRILLIQNPTEFTFFERDTLGTNKRNVVHWEANDALDGNTESKTSGTARNLLNNALRFTPTVIILGETRRDDEFGLAAAAGFMGHRLLATYHSDSAQGAVNRGAMALAKDMHIPLSDAGPQWASVTNVVVAQRRYPDGSRRIKEITEISVENGVITYTPVVQYQYNDVITDTKTGKPCLDGEYRFAHAISKKFQDLLLEAFVPSAEFEEFTHDTCDLYA